MTRVEWKCGYCTVAGSFDGDVERLDQTVYMEISEHVEAAHAQEARDIRQLPTRARKLLLLSWASVDSRPIAAHL